MTKKNSIGEELAKEVEVLRQKVADLERLNNNYKQEIETLREEDNSNLKNIFSPMNDPALVLDKEGHFTESRMPSEELYLSSNKFIGKKYPEVMPLNVKDLCMQAFNKNKNGEVAEYEYSLNVKSKKQWYHAKQSPLFMDGQFNGAVLVIRNITEQKSLFRQLKESEKRYHSLVELGGRVGEAVVMLQDIDGKEGVHVFANDQWSYITGYSKKELLGMSFFDLISPEYRQAALARHRKKVSGESIPYYFEMYIIRKDGTEVPIELTSGYSTYQGKRANVVYIRDITERKQMEQALRKATDEYIATINMNEDIIIRTDKEGRRTLVNDKACIFFGLPRKELLGKKFGNYTHPDDISETLHVIDNAIKTKRSIYNYVCRQVTSTGIKTIDWNICPFYDGNGEYEGLQMTGHDITERRKIEEELEQHRQNLELLINKRTGALKKEIEIRKKAEEVLKKSELRYHALFEDVPVGIFETDYSKLKKHLNELQSQGIKDFREYFDNNPDELLKAKNLLNVINANKATLDLYEVETKDKILEMFREPIKNKERFYSFLKKIIINIAEGKKQFSYERYIPTLKGRWRHYLVKIHIAPGHELDYSLAYVSIIDITEIRHLENSLKKAYTSEKKIRKKLELEVRQKSEYINFIVHELKTPLTPLLAASDELLSNYKYSEITQCAKRISIGTLKMNKRIDELMDIARSELGVLKINPKNIDIKDLINETIDYFKAEAFKNNKKIEYFSPEQSCIIWADEDRIQQVMLNLIDNALKITNRGGKIYVKIISKQKDIIIKVQDFGRGVNPKIKKYLFETQKKPKIDSDYLNGLGLGLSLCKIFIELHGGKIWVDSILGEGSTFSFSLPKYAN